MTTTLDRPSDVDISLDIDLSLLVGPMEDMECEHSQHPIRQGGRQHDSGPATHYIRNIHVCENGNIYAACSRFTFRVERGDMNVFCDKCQHRGPSEEFLEVAGRIGE